MKDVAARRRINDIELLESIVKFLFDNVGNIVSSKKIADSLTLLGRKTTSLTAENYVTALCEAFILYKVGRYDVQGKQHLKSLEKYYIVDVGLRNLLIGNRNRDISHILENIVYLELTRKGYHVSVGKLGELAIDFVAEKDGEKAYYQVAATVLSEEIFAREIAPLKRIHDNYPKYIVTMDELPMDEEGIKIINVVDFLTK
ncbi:ATP-binding protein [Ruminococcus albus]|uniref:ATP-binding protein n=1 Tax=Ruminococcus albus TaxID=1264 RepID=UPI0001E0C169